MTSLEEPPPILGNWKRLYGLVLGTLAVMIALCSVITYVYR